MPHINQKTSRKNFFRGFTIIELLVVVAVIGILVSIVIVSYGAVQRNARDTSVLSDLDALEGVQTQYGLDHGVAGKAWYSGDGVDADLNFTPSEGNVIDIVVNSTDYCIRGYNPTGTKNSIDNAITKESTAGVCISLNASIAAGGIGGDGNSLLGWWKLNGNANDSSGNGNNGTVNGAIPSTGQNGVSSGAYSFDGIDDYINLGILSAIGGLTNNLTVSAWVSVPVLSPKIILAPSRLNSADGIGLAISETGVRFTTYGVKDYDIASVGLTTNTWYLLTAAMDSTNNVTFFVNGVQKGTIGHATSAKVNTNDVYQIGANTVGSSSTLSGLFQGSIDDLRIYNRYLSPAEILAMYDAGAQ